jgi:hypothetical protein
MFVATTGVVELRWEQGTRWAGDFFVKHFEHGLFFKTFFWCFLTPLAEKHLEMQQIL